jgi:multicomponent Na+:H+ antiporter subunit G
VSNLGEWIAATLMVAGAMFILLASIGVVRMPDVFTRMHVASKSSVLGAGLVMLSVAVWFGQLGVVTRSFLVIIFFVLTTPVAAHMIARAAYFGGVPRWEGTVIDQLEGRYDPDTHRLDSPDPSEMASVPITHDPPIPLPEN